MIVVQLYRSASDSIGKRHEAESFATFAHEVRDGLSETRGHKHELPAFGAYDLQGTRSNANVRAWSALVFDLDHIPVKEWEAARANLEGFSCFWYSSPSDEPTSGTRKVRLVLEIDRPLAPDELNRARDYLGTVLGIRNDPKARSASQMYFVGRLEGTAQREFELIAGAALPVDTILRDAPPTPEAPSASVILGDTEAVEPALGRARAWAATTTPAVQGQNGSATLYHVACKLWFGFGLSRRQTFEVLKDVFGPRCEPSWTDEKELWHKVESAAAATTHQGFRGADALDLFGAMVRGAAAGQGQDQDEDPRFSPGYRDPGAAMVSADWKREIHFTDTGNAKRLVAKHGRDLRYSSERAGWLSYDGKRWELDRTGDIERKAKRTILDMYNEASELEDEDTCRKLILTHAKASESGRALAAMVKLAQSEPGMHVRVADLDADPWLFNVQNGTLDLRTGTLRPHAREALITKMAPVDYVPGAKLELWDQFIETATNGDRDLAGYLQRMVGYAMQGTVTEKVFFFLYGPPDGGKSTFIDAVMGAFGDYATSAAFSTWLQQTNVGGNRGDLVRLAGTRLVTSCEVKKFAKFDEEVIKKITGGDMITAAAKHEHDVSYKPSCTLLFAANDAPLIRDDDAGMWSRVRRIPFTNVVPKAKQDRDLRAKLGSPEARQAILAWALAGCLEWQEHGLGVCAAVDRSTEAYRAEMDRLAPFLDDQLVFEPGARLPAASLRSAYEAYCRAEGIRYPATAKELAAKLKERGAESTKSHGAIVWKGVGLAPDLGRGTESGAGGIFTGLGSSRGAVQS